MKQQSITSLPPSPEAERRSRMIRYSIAMAIRLLCIFAMLFVQGWWLAVCAVGAIVLPYIAVVLANVSGPGLGGAVERPGTIVPVSGSTPGTTAPPTNATGREAGADDPTGTEGERGDGSARMPRTDDDRNAA
ncbi:DUF3099 domain-containing protein [Agromyces aureus]|uniref:DUF3099 domain-containing protein n=1 Tax=Agromyces aureus TaxID=453304 RepID=UPI0008379881|nr:DUF3099 domain-containing protein [Agromyces aureus]